MAGLVVVGHVRGLLFCDAPQVAPLSVPWKGFYFLTGFGHAAVVVFFVLSGFFVGGKLLAKTDVDDRVIRRYLVDRTSRIYIVLGPALLLTVLLDSAGAMLSPIYGDVGWSTALPQPAAAALDFKNLFASFFNVTMYVGGPLGSNGPLWSLAFEWLIYLMFPWLLVDLRRLRSGRYNPAMIARAAIGVALVIGSPALGLWLVVWLLGVVAYWRVHAAPVRNGVRDNLMLAGFAAALVAMFIIARLSLVPGWASDLGIGLATAGLCTRRRVIRWRGATSFQDWMAGFSFSLYVTHFPVALFAVAILQHQGYVIRRLYPNVTALAIFVVVVSTAYLCAWLFSRMTEAHTHRFRRVLSALLAVCEEEVRPV